MPSLAHLWFSHFRHVEFFFSYKQSKLKIPPGSIKGENQTFSYRATE